MMNIDDTVSLKSYEVGGGGVMLINFEPNLEEQVWKI